MKIGHAFFLVVSSLWMAGVSLGRLDSDKTLHVRVAAYNVEFGKNASPEEIGKMFKPYDLDIIGFNEVPDGDWTARVGKVLDMKHTYVGKISSANHKDKYKSILSRTTLQDTIEHELSVQRRRSWNPASVVQAVTQIEGIPVSFIPYIFAVRQTVKKRAMPTGWPMRFYPKIKPTGSFCSVILITRWVIMLFR